MKFIEAQGKLKKIYTLEEIIGITKGQWGHGKFIEIVKSA